MTQEAPQESLLAATPAAWKVWLNRVGPALGLAAVFTFFAILEPKMATSGNIEEIGRETVVVGITAVGMTMVIISAGIDLSVGSMIAFSSVVIATLMKEWGFSPLQAAACGVLAGALCGLVNGLLITLLGIVPFIITLCLMSLVRGGAKRIAHSRTVNFSPTWLSELLAVGGPAVEWSTPTLIILWTSRVILGAGALAAVAWPVIRALRPDGERSDLVPALGLAAAKTAAIAAVAWYIWYWSAGVWVMGAFATLAALMLRYTRLGRHVFAVGSNEQTARLCGVAVNRVKLFVYVFSGAAAGLGGLMLLSYQDQGDPTGAVAYELHVIAAVIIGGGSFSGGQGSILGTLIGAAVIRTIPIGCGLNGWPPYVTEIVTGIIIIVAVALDRLRHRRAA